MATAEQTDILSAYRGNKRVLLVMSDRPNTCRAGLSRMQVNALDVSDCARRDIIVLCADPAGITELTPRQHDWGERILTDNDLDLRARFGMARPFTIVYIDAEGHARDASASPVATDQIVALIENGTLWEDEVDAPWLTAKSGSAIAPRHHA